MDAEHDLPADFEADEAWEAEVDAYIARNRDALNESIRIARAEFAQGIYSTRTIADLIAEKRAHHRDR